MPTCPYGVQTSFEPRNCPCAQRITDCEETAQAQKNELKEVKTMIRSPQVTVAFITLFGSLFCGFMGFLGVVLGPLIRSYFGV